MLARVIITKINIFKASNTYEIFLIPQPSATQELLISILKLHFFEKSFKCDFEDGQNANGILHMKIPSKICSLHLPAQIIRGPH